MIAFHHEPRISEPQRSQRAPRMKTFVFFVPFVVVNLWLRDEEALRRSGA
jgi:hypothetical protein